MKILGLILIISCFVFQGCTGIKSASNQFKYVQCSADVMPIPVSKKVIKANKSLEKKLEKRKRKVR